MAGETTRSISATASAMAAASRVPGAGRATRFGEIEGALEVVTGMEARGQQEVPLLVRTAGGEVFKGQRVAHWSSREMP